MRHSVPAIAVLAAPFLLAGCMRPITSTGIRSDSTAVSVRFLTAPQPGTSTDQPRGSNDASPAPRTTARRTALLVDAEYDGFSDQGGTDETPGTSFDVYHVALWGGPFEGNDVTYGVTSMTPGSYTFAFLDRAHGSTVQGWVDVNRTGNDILDMLYKWKSGISEQRRRLAYDYELSGSAKRADAGDFDGFRKQLSALKRLERRIDRAVAAELKALPARRASVSDLLSRSEVLLMPGGGVFFHPTTRPAFTDADLAAVRGGDAVTKIVLVADHDDARWKLRRVDELYGDLSRCREVFRREVDRLERRKGLFLLTDHLHHHDKRFVENEILLQQALTCIDRLNKDMADLHERRTALAFVAGLFAPKGHFRAIDQEQDDLMRERSVLDAEQRRTDLLLSKVEESSVSRVALERKRQETLAAIEAVDRHLRDLTEARSALKAMTESTQVIHRAGDSRLLTATLVCKDLPYAVRRAVERESVMTVRLEAGDDVFVPTRTSTTASTVGTGPTFTPQPEARGGARLASLQESQGTAHGHQQGQAVVPNDDDQKEKDESCDLPLIIRLLAPPCWFPD